MKELATVVVPLSGAPLTEREMASLRRCREVLHAYPIVLVTPHGANYQAEVPWLSDLDQYTFEVPPGSTNSPWESHFLSDDLYERFAWSEFILVHQLNSYVVSDELHYWCKQGYDYIQALPGLVPQSRSAQVLEQELGLKTKVPLPQLAQAVAGTGLSLRRVERMRRAIRNNKRKIYELLSDRTLSGLDKDVLFWEGLSRRLWPPLRVPTPVVRQRFSVNVASLGTSFGQQVLSPNPFALTGLDGWSPEQFASYLN
ncbi:hypothetical protein GCM10027275_15620 [Rhabdobacter roseus]|uniref:DUF5672 domain-containing protein n=1 Tax=Rhabdobacter roseus TaxID=1655419 RepID=A0A840TPJ4_9BACT|nr:DUF5672 family protein [Rhabdobacter roseus]MBB5283482.1 hypothetical protein [Rhabdobacter roseus]